MRHQTQPETRHKSAVTAGLLLVLLLLAPTVTSARDIGIIITGGDKHPDVAAWRDSLGDEFEKEFKRRSGDTSDVSRPDRPSAVESAIKGLEGQVECGEDIVIYFNGHGSSSGRLNFTYQENGRTRTGSVSPKDMLDWLKAAALPCSCRIHLVIHACYSGEFVEQVAKGDIHVVTAISSATDTRPAHKDVRGTVAGGAVFDGADWPTGLDEDLDSVPPATDWQTALQTAKKSAKEKMKDKWQDKDKPQTWKRFKGYHVEEVTIDPKTKVKTIKLKSPDGSERTVVMGPGVKVKVGDEELEYCVVDSCSYVTVLVQVSEKGEYVVRQCVGSINISGATGHVQGRSGDTFSMHFDAPPHLKCETRDVRPSPGEQLPDWVRYCRWVVLDSCYQDSTGITAGTITATDPPDIEIKGHVQSADPEKGEFEIHISKPDWLRCNTRKVTMKPGERLPAWVRKCKWVKLTGKLTDSITDATGIAETDPENLSYTGHVRAVANGRATVHIQKPDWLLCEVKVLQPPRGTTLPGWVRPCTTITFQGPLTGDTIKLGSFGMGRIVIASRPVDIDFKAHVESVGPDYIVVTIKEPERMAGQQRRLKLGPGQAIPEGVEFCKTITFTGNVIYDSIVNGRSIRLAGTPAGTDAGAEHIIAPGAEVPAYALLTPEVRIRNYGSLPTPIPLPVRCFVDSLGITVYFDSTTIGDLEPGETALAQFREWQAGEPGIEYEVTFATRLPGDEDPSNDAISRPVLVGEAENRSPMLAGGKVEPPLGPHSQYFTYALVYSDVDGDEPVTHDVLIDGEPRPMMVEGGEPLSGMHFFLETPLEPGVHSFRFLFDDGQGHIVETEELPGPVVEPED